MRIFMAPMEGVIDYHLRCLFQEIGGVDISVTEFIRVNDHVLPEKVFKKYCPELINSKSIRRLGSVNVRRSQKFNQPMQTRVQLLGSNAKIISLNAAKVARMGADGIDLNFGCPAKTVNKNRGGACLLDETDLLYDIVAQTRDAVPENIPVTAKIRLGYNARDSYIKNARAIERAGADELVVHARSKRDAYHPPAYWEAIAEIRNEINIPVVANGEVWTVEDYFKCKKASNCHDVMLGRGLLANPDLALRIKHDSSGLPYQPEPWHVIASYLLRFFQQTCNLYPSKHTGNRVKQWLYYLKMQYPEATILFERIKRSKERAFIEKCLRANVTIVDSHESILAL